MGPPARYTEMLSMLAVVVAAVKAESEVDLVAAAYSAVEAAVVASAVLYVSATFGVPV